MNLDFTSLKILVVGDLMLDHYLFGTSTRMSPEAPVPVVIPDKEVSIPGGAANVAMNLSSLGANVKCFGVVGNDKWGKTLLDLLDENRIDINNIEVVNEFRTTVKHRLYSNGNQVARLDIEDYLEKECSFMNSKYNDYDVIILSDYNKGVLAKPWFNKPKNIPVVMDPKKENSNFFNISVLTPNLNELSSISNTKIETPESIEFACKHLINKYNIDYILAKKGENGMSVFGKNNFNKHLDAHKVATPDVTGAGDTVIASFAVAYAKTKDIEQSATFSNMVASIAVGKSGTSTVTIKDINNYIKS